jgi:hypothetical protein
MGDHLLTATLVSARCRQLLGTNNPSPSFNTQAHYGNHAPHFSAWQRLTPVPHNGEIPALSEPFFPSMRRYSSPLLQSAAIITTSSAVSRRTTISTCSKMDVGGTESGSPLGRPGGDRLRRGSWSRVIRAKHKGHEGRILYTLIPFHDERDMVVMAATHHE